jgi:NurA-like 5'-3' nuclease
MQEIFNALTVVNTMLIFAIFYLLLAKFKVRVTETDLIRIISALGSITQILKFILRNPDEKTAKTLAFVEELLKTIEKEIEKRYKREEETETTK